MAKSAVDYPITTGYGYIPGYPLNNGWHRGQDRAMPVGTPVVVNGTTIGLSGNTGASTGSHLHIGRFVNGQDTDPLGRGFTLSKPAVVLDTGYDAANGNYVRVQDAQGVVWVYLHLSKITASKGQKLEGEDVEPTDYRLNKGDVINGFKIWGRVPSQADLDAWVGQPFKKFVYEKITEGVALMPPPGVKPYEGPPLFVSDK